MFTVTRGEVDWLTITSRSYGDALLLRQHYKEFRDKYGQGAGEPKKVKFGGYDGEQTGGVTFGTRYDSWILVARGGAAHAMWELGPPTAGRTTRVDVKADVLLEEPEEFLAGRVAEKHRNGVRIGRTTYYPLLITNFEGGQTVYFGKRTGRFFMRLYDKAAQTGAGEPGSRWRFETQYNQEAAQAAARKLLAGSGSLGDTCVSLLLDKWRHLGIIEGNCKGINLDKPEPYLVIYEPGRTLEWIKTSVEPALARLINNGYGSQVTDILGKYMQARMTLED